MRNNNGIKSLFFCFNNNSSQNSTNNPTASDPNCELLEINKRQYSFIRINTKILKYKAILV